EGGVVPAKKEFLQKLQQVCTEKNVLLIIDEIQTGMGRTGKMFAYEHFGLTPDIITLAKGLGGGFPIGAMLAKQEIAEHLQPGDHGTTFGGNPLACAAAIAVIDAIVEDGLVKKAEQMGKYALEQLQLLAQKHSSISEVRALGLMIGVQFDQPCREHVMQLLEHGVLVSCTAESVIRIVPPLVINKDEIDRVVDALEMVLSQP
ncbi:MAG: aminotransferase class III-fold pyridoxal phosphate-dependent enzyme, partial [Cyclobacteriaceae bacterium]